MNRHDSLDSRSGATGKRDPDIRTAFVTGAAGFLGRHLVETLCQQGWEVTCLCLPSDDSSVLPMTAKVMAGDVTDIDSVRTAMPSAPDAVFHLAADTSTWSRHAKRQYQVNVIGTANVIDVARQKSARRLVYTSSISAYGYQPGHRIDERTPSNALTHGDSYGKSKLRAEELIKDVTSRGQLSAVILNPVNILGPQDRNNWSRQLILPVSQGKLRAVPPGTATWAYVQDVVAAHLAAVDHGRSGENYLLGGVEASFAEVVTEIGRILGRRPIRRVAPKAVLRLGLWAAMAKSAVTNRRPALTPPQYRRAVGELLCDDGKARRELGYPRTALRTMLIETIEWLRHEHLLDSDRSTRQAGREPERRESAVLSPAGSAFRRDHRLGIEYVEVDDEPQHVEQYRNDDVRIYLASIDPGSWTQYHRHRVNTMYIVMAGGLCRSDEPGHQRQRTRVGRSTGAIRTLAMGLQRSLSGTSRLPTGMLLMQYHMDFPLTHRLHAAHSNPGPIRMLGIELRSAAPSGARPQARLPGLPIEYRDAQATAYRVRLAPGQSTARIALDRPALLVLAAATGQLRTTTAEMPVRPVPPGTWQWLDGGDDFELGNIASTRLDALLITLTRRSASTGTGSG